MMQQQKNLQTDHTYQRVQRHNIADEAKRAYSSSTYLLALRMAHGEGMHKEDGANFFNDLSYIFFFVRMYFQRLVSDSR
jgi:hypothetical protein